MVLEPGLNASVRRVVEPAMTAAAMGSGSVDVLATPQVVLWCEEATVAALTDELAPSETTVGMRVRVEHLRPTPVGATVTVEAVLSQVEGRRLIFDVSGRDDHGEIVDGQIVRVLVDHDRFMKRAAG